jgi:hypothetical protein
MFDHKETAGHSAAIKLIVEAEKESVQYYLKGLSREVLPTATIFRTVYEVAKESQSSHNSESDIDVQELNGIDMGRIRH